MNSLQLDARQLAMLEAMGVTLVGWKPRVEADAAKAQTVPAQASLTGTQSPIEAPAAAGGPEIARAPRAARTPSATAAPVEAPPRTPMAVGLDAPQCLHGAGDAPGGWLIVADLPPHARQQPEASDERRLLGNMLRALGLHAGHVPVHLACTHRSAPGEADPPFDQALAQQLQTLAPRVVLAMGPLAAQHLLGRSEPIGKLRGVAAPLPSHPATPVVATYHLDYLLRNGADKAKAWADLCEAAAVFEKSKP